MDNENTVFWWPTIFIYSMSKDDRNMDIKRSTLICVLYSTKPREDLLLEE